MPASSEGLRRERPGRSGPLHFGNRGGCMSYAVKSIFYTLQGEGANVGRPAVFCRFAGCNLWSGREEDRATATCQFCDTEFVGTDGPGGGRFRSAEELARAVSSHWPGPPSQGHPFVVCTGGEPLLQLDDELVAASRQGFEIAVETNGTVLPPTGLDWVTVSPKAGAELLLRAGQELKLVFPKPVCRRRRSRNSISGTSSSSPWTGRTSRPTPASPCVTASRTRVGG